MPSPHDTEDAAFAAILLERPWLQSWPPSLRKLVEEHGCKRVWDVGLDVLGFPPNWSEPSVTQANRLRVALEEQTQQGELK